MTNFYTAELSVHVCSLLPFLCVYLLHSYKYLPFKCIISQNCIILEMFGHLMKIVLVTLFLPPLHVTPITLKPSTTELYVS